MKKSDFIKNTITENIVPYGNNAEPEQAEQYSPNENFTKLLYTTLNGSAVQWYSKNVSDDYNTEGNLEIDWGINFIIHNNTFTFKIFIKSITGTLSTVHYENNQQNKKDFPFNSKGFRIDANEDADNILSSAGSYGITHIEIDIDAKTIQLSNY